MLELIKLTAGYNHNEILKDISIHVKSNEIVSIFGHNGSGKSTLLKSIFNLTDIYSGKILFKNENLTKLNTFELIKHGISYVPQEHKIFRKLSVKENLELNISNPKVLDNLYNIFPFIREKMDDIAKTLSGGQQQLLGICRALIQNPRLILLDEPSLGLDQKFMKLVFEKIKEINNNGVTILVAEQNIDRAIKITDRYYFLDNGRVVLEGKNKLSRNIWKAVC